MTEDNHEILSEASGRTGKDFKGSPLKYKSEALPPNLCFWNF
jgi:hypothetical protein